VSVGLVERRVALFDDSVGCRCAKVGSRGDAVVAERFDAQRHPVLGDVRMGELVDRVRHVVAPVLEELHRRARVVDLVEVHAVGHLEPIRAHEEGGKEDHHQQHNVATAELTAHLALEERAPVAPNRKAGH